MFIDAHIFYDIGAETQVSFFKRLHSEMQILIYMV